MRAFAAKTVILMTDGNHNRGPKPDRTVATAVNRIQRVHTSTFSREAKQNLLRLAGNFRRTTDPR